jgi:signal transduction histidine kinase
MNAAPDRERLALLVHELRSPVAALTAISAALGDRELDTGSLRELVRLALGASRSVDRIVDDAALGPLALADVDVARVVRDAVAAAALQGGAVRARIEEGVPRLNGDAVRLRQALDNLIHNALVHSGPEAAVVVAARRDGHFVVVSVADSGRGISEGDQERIFEPGVRLDSAGEGSGLGLAVAESVARAHGGSLSVESTRGSGATFTISLPADGSGSTEAS